MDPLVIDPKHGGYRTEHALTDVAALPQVDVLDEAARPWIAPARMPGRRLAFRVLSENPNL
jgi:hypothetical protein